MDGNVLRVLSRLLASGEDIALAGTKARFTALLRRSYPGGKDVDLVTEGVITMNKVLVYARDALDKNDLYDKWSFNRDGASQIARLLFEEATDINFFVGRAVNPAHQNPSLPINFNIKMNLVDELSKCLKKMGKRIKVSYL